MKACKDCNTPLPEDSDYRTRFCAPCRRERKRAQDRAQRSAYYAANRDKVLAKAREDYAANPAPYRAAARAHYYAKRDNAPRACKHCGGEISGEAHTNRRYHPACSGIVARELVNKRRRLKREAARAAPPPNWSWQTVPDSVMADAA